MRRFPLLIVLGAALCLMGQNLHSQAPQNCLVSGYVFNLSELPAAAGVLTIIKAEQNGTAVPLSPFTVIADENGFVQFNAPRNSKVWVEGNFVQGLNRLGGVPLQIPDADTTRLELLWQLQDGVTSVNGRTGNLSLGAPDITSALGYSPLSPSSVISALNSSPENVPIQDSKLSLNMARLNAPNAFQEKVSIGTKTADPSANLTLKSADLQNAVGMSIIQAPRSKSALDIHTDWTGQSFEFGLRFFTPETPAAYQPRLFINTAGAVYSNAWMIISGHMGNPLTEGAYYIHHPSNENVMLGIWSDIHGPALQVRGSGGKSTGSYLFSGLDYLGSTTFLVEEDGELRWGPPSDINTSLRTNRTASDTNLYRAGPGNLKTDSSLAVGGNIATNGDISTSLYRLRSMSRVLPTVKNATVAVGDFTAGASALDISVVVASAGNEVAKNYSLPVQYNSAAADWATAIPIASTGSYQQQDFDLDIKIVQSVISLRLRNSGSGGVAGTAYITMQHTGRGDESFSSSTATGTAIPPTQIYASNLISQVKGGIGVATASPASDALMDLDGGDNKGLRLRPRSKLGSPTTGTWSAGTMILDSGGVLYVCTRSGTPGTWQSIGSQK